MPPLTLFPTCLMENFAPQAVRAAVHVLERRGFRVHIPRRLTCCGQPAFNAGYWPEARRMARHTLKTLEASAGPVVLLSGSCTAMIRNHYPDLFAEEPDRQARLRALAQRVFEFSEFLWTQREKAPPPSAAPLPQVAYHPSCHLLRTLGVDQQPKGLLRAAGVDFSALPPECCGFGGVFAVEQPELSGELLARKIAAIEASGAQVVTGCDISCLLHIEGGLRKRGSSVRCLHLARILEAREAA